MITPALEAIQIATSSKVASYPGRESEGWQGDLYCPPVSPKFQISSGSRIFTIGSCFARNIERRLAGFDLPTRNISEPAEEWLKPGIDPGNNILNEYNPGTMSQRLIQAFNGDPDPERLTIVDNKAGRFDDLLLHGRAVLTHERAVERREQVNAIYRRLPDSDVVIITLGLVECWFDTKAGMYLNKMPPLRIIQRDKERYQFRRFDVDMAMNELGRAFALLSDAGKSVILTVSPVPLGKTFTKNSAFEANCYSKSVLRVCAQLLSERFSNVAYFPSFEIVTGNGHHSLMNDNVHVRSDVVEFVTANMMESYVSNPSEHA